MIFFSHSSRIRILKLTFALVCSCSEGLLTTEKHHLVPFCLLIFCTLCLSIHFASCARAYETWKQCHWIMRTLTCKHKIWGKNWLYLRPYLKAFPIFNVLETCREYFLTIDLGIVEFIEKFIERFLEKCEIFRHGPNYVQKLYQKQLNAS